MITEAVVLWKLTFGYPRSYRLMVHVLIALVSLDPLTFAWMYTHACMSFQIYVHIHSKLNKLHAVAYIHKSTIEAVHFITACMHACTHSLWIHSSMDTHMRTRTVVLTHANYRPICLSANMRMLPCSSAATWW
jgi:hypothetical protein